MIFDLDGTLAESKGPIDVMMATVLGEATQKMNIVVITGGMFEQIERQVIAKLPVSTNLQNFFILPTTGSAMYQYVGQQWLCVYELRLSQTEIGKIEKAFEQVLHDVSFHIEPDMLKGPQLENRGTQFTFSALGQLQDINHKRAWDPDRSKREELQLLLQPQLPEFDVKIGGTTSIDVTRSGVTKAYGIRKFFEISGFDIVEAVFVGDEIREKGNDYAALETGIDTYGTKGPDDTRDYIQRVLAMYETE